MLILLEKVSTVWFEGSAQIHSSNTYVAEIKCCLEFSYLIRERNIEHILDTLSLLNLLSFRPNQ
jgi:hypothetical protein